MVFRSSFDFLRLLLPLLSSDTNFTYNAWRFVICFKRFGNTFNV